MCQRLDDDYCHTCDETENQHHELADALLNFRMIIVHYSSLSTDNSTFSGWQYLILRQHFHFMLSNSHAKSSSGFTTSWVPEQALNAMKLIGVDLCSAKGSAV